MREAVSGMANWEARRDEVAGTAVAGHSAGCARARATRDARRDAQPHCDARKSSYFRGGERLVEEQYARLEAAAAQMAR